MGLIEPANVAAIVVASTSTLNLSNADLIALDFRIDKTINVSARNIALQAVLAFKPVDRKH
jgi:hypothetical protein